MIDVVFFSNKTTNPLFFFKPHVLIFLCVKRVDLGFLTAYLQYKPASSSALLSPQAPSRQPPYRPHTLSSANPTVTFNPLVLVS